MKNFPHLVQMHTTHAAAGLVCMSVNAVETDPADRTRILKFLSEKGATFPNFVLKDTEANEERWKAQYPTIPPPLVLLFDRQGNRVKVFDEPDHHVIEAEVKRLLAAN